MSNYKHAVIIPTCAETEILLHSVPRFFMHARENTIFIFSFNPKNMEVAKKTEKLIKFFYEDLKDNELNNFEYDILWSDDAIGFGCAVNKGLKHLKDSYGLTDYITIANDDLEVTDGWQEGMEKGFHLESFTTQSKAQLAKTKEEYKISIKELNGKVGIVGPVSNGVFNEQRNLDPENLHRLGIDVFAKWRLLNHRSCGFVPTSFLSGFCICLSKEALEDLCDETFEYGGIFDTRFTIGGYEDDDLMYRAMKKGWRLMIDTETFIGHKVSQTLNKHFKEHRSGLGNGAKYLLKWEEETQKEQKVVAVYRTSVKCVNDLNQLHNSLLRTNQILDGVSILLTNNPKEIITSFDQMFLNHLPKDSQEFVNKCAALPDDISEAKEGLIEALSEFLTSLQIKEFNIDVWTGDFNERDERNRTHKMAEELNPDYIFSIDSDEIFEDRLTRNHIQRILQHPNPHRMMFTVGFINHWETMKLVREDKHYGSMMGYRVWRNFKNAQRIYGGNDIGFHCGNSPELGGYGRKVSSMRMRHLSHVRRVDRDNKAKFYDEVDQDKNAYLIGGSDYSHINQQNDIKISLYNPKNGLAFTMLAYEKEDWVNIMNWLDNMYAVADRICMVWTGEWSDDDKDWLSDPSILKGMTKEEYESKYSTGMCWELAQVTRLFKVEWIHHKLDEKGLASCRNAGIDYLDETNNGSINWLLFMDPDEVCTNNLGFHLALVDAIKRVDNYGFMFKFKNPVNSNGTNSGSESIRLVQLNKFTRLSGLVHETFEESFKLLKNSGTHPNVQYFPIEFINTGLSKSPEQMAEKLIKYRDMLVDQLNESPFDSASWVSLSLQYMNDDDFDNAETCLSRGMLCAGDAYLPFKEYAIFLLRKAEALLLESHKRTHRGHRFHQISENMIKTIKSWKLDLPKVDTGGVSISDTTKLPYFPTPEEFMNMKQKALEEKNGNEIQNENEESGNE
jgi:hypothetical protein